VRSAKPSTYVKFVLKNNKNEQTTFVHENINLNRASTRLTSSYAQTKLTFYLREKSLFTKGKKN
jgi:hypothetical protein